MSQKWLHSNDTHCLLQPQQQRYGDDIGAAMPQRHCNTSLKVYFNKFLNNKNYKVYFIYFSEQKLQIMVLVLLFIHFVSKLYRNACYLISKRIKVMVIYKITLTEKIHNFQVACKDFCVTLSGFAPIKCTKKHICYL